MVKYYSSNIYEEGGRYKIWRLENYPDRRTEEQKEFDDDYRRAIQRVTEKLTVESQTSYSVELQRLEELEEEETKAEERGEEAETEEEKKEKRRKKRKIQPVTNREKVIAAMEDDGGIMTPFEIQLQTRLSIYIIKNILQDLNMEKRLYSTGKLEYKLVD